MKNHKKNGISIIILIISILVIIILASVIILTTVSSNPISRASKVTFINDLQSFDDELNAYKTEQRIYVQKGYNALRLQADENSVTYNDVVDNSKTINDIIPLLGDTPKYDNLFEVVNGELVFKGTDPDQIDWAKEVGMEVIVAGEPKVTITALSDTLVVPGTDVIYTIGFSSSVAIPTINLTEKVEVTDVTGVALSEQPNISVGTASGEPTDLVRSINVTIETGTLGNAKYKLRIKAGAVTNENNISNMKDVLSLTGFTVDNAGPQNPIILASPVGWTNGNVTITINYSTDSSTKQYSTNGTDWNTYTSSVVVSTNGTTVYAKATDILGNQSGQSTLTVANIDKVLPTLMFGTNGGSGSQVSTTVTVSDLGGSSLKASTLQYVWDIQSLTTPNNGWSTFTNGATITNNVDGTYYLWVKASDNAGNTLITKSNEFVVNTLPYVLADEAVTEPTPVTNVSTDHSTINGQLPVYNNPIIPAGFGAVNTTDASWDNVSTDWDKGLVIQDTNGNQFVWVPINNTTVTYAKWCTTGMSYTIPVEDALPTGVVEGNQIASYGGFYIGRFESAFDYNGGSPRLACKKNTAVSSSTNWSATRNASYTGYLWNFMNYTDSRNYALNMATSYGYNLTKVKTGLLTGTQFDTTLKWIENSGKSVTDSSAWGNHAGTVPPANTPGAGTLQPSGYSEFWKAKNIYDLAGNSWEWTNEIDTTNCVGRGGFYSGSGGGIPVAYRFNFTGEDIINYLAFRPVLYVL